VPVTEEQQAGRVNQQVRTGEAGIQFQACDLQSTVESSAPNHPHFLSVTIPAQPQLSASLVVWKIAELQLSCTCFQGIRRAGLPVLQQIPLQLVSVAKSSRVTKSLVAREISSLTRSKQALQQIRISSAPDCRDKCHLDATSNRSALLTDCEVLRSSVG